MKNVSKIALVALVSIIAGNSYALISPATNLQRDAFNNRERVKERREEREKREGKESREHQRGQNFKNSDRGLANSGLLK